MLFRYGKKKIINAIKNNHIVKLNIRVDYTTPKKIEPRYKSSGFNCPHCGLFAKQNFYTPCKGSDYNQSYWSKILNVFWDGEFVDYHNHIYTLSVCFCDYCDEYTLWVNKQLVYPNSTIAPEPVNDMPVDVKYDFIEARDVVQRSPRSAAALLRLALQKLMPHIGQDGKNINRDIGNLVNEGMSKELQKQLDVLRVIGNESVHPGELDMKDDIETAIALFHLLNSFVQLKITSKITTENLLNNKVPNSKREHIRLRQKK